MPLRAPASAISVPIPAYSEFSEVALHPLFPERSSTPFPSNVTNPTERFEYPFPTPQTIAQAQTPPFSVSQAFPSTSLLPSPSSPWPSPSSSPSSSSLSHGPPRAYAAVHGHGFSPRSGPNTPPVSVHCAHAHRLGHAHIHPAQLCVLASANPPIPPSLAQKRGMLELRISSLDSKGAETIQALRGRA